jgi:hypothetical protein
MQPLQVCAEKQFSALSACSVLSKFQKEDAVPPNTLLTHLAVCSQRLSVSAVKSSSPCSPCLPGNQTLKRLSAKPQASSTHCRSSPKPAARARPAI